MSSKVLSTYANVISRYVRPVLSASTLFSCTLFTGDLVGQYISSRASNVDLKRSLCIGLSGFCVSGPLSFSIGQMLLRLYPGNGRLTVLKRVMLSTCVSPLTIACGIAPSVYLQTRDVDAVMQRLVNRVPLSWALSIMLLSPFSYMQYRLLDRRYHKVAKNSFSILYNTILSSRKRVHMDEEVLADLLLL